MFLALIIIGPQAQGAVWEVCPTCTLTSLKDAVGKAARHDTIILRPGLYKEWQIIVNKPMTLIGIDMPVIQGNTFDEILTVEADSVMIDGIEFRDAGFSYVKDLAAIRIKRHDYFTIRNTRIINAFFGIYIENGKHGLIEDNVLIGYAKDEMSSGNAIHCWYASDLQIRWNNMRGYRDGIYLEFVHNSTITDNISEKNVRYGLHFMFSNDDVYNCNIFRENGAGVAVMFSKRIEMMDNVFSNNWGRASYGLLLKEIYDAEIRNNIFTQNTIGILIEGCTRLRYEGNAFSGNGWAIQMSGGCLDNVFIRNNFNSNTMDLVVNGRVNNNLFDGNYWSTYSGYDIDRDGVGDVPHRPVKLFSYILTKSPESIVLLRSFFIDILNFSEKVSPALTPENVLDQRPLMRPAS